MKLDGIAGWAALVALIVLFFLPLEIALYRKVPTLFWIVFFNVALGVTGVGWIAALVLAVTEKPKK